MNALVKADHIIMILFFVGYAYQFLYIPISWFGRGTGESPAKVNRYAILICARNEALVLPDLIESLHQQTYNQHLLTIFVMADNCTDDTAKVARMAGAVVYERFDKTRVGKGYALESLLEQIRQEYQDVFDGYFVFDADNILAADFIEQMNRTFSAGHEIVSSYRASKNGTDNWVAAGYALWFLRESRYLNQARMKLRTSCAVSGTGFLFSRRILHEQNGWPYHTLTEDIEFSICQILQGERIALCEKAVLYDEQPTSFRQSFRQRLRWCRGYLQVLRRYGGKMFLGMLRGSFSCYDMCMNILPAFLLTLSSVLLCLVRCGMALAGGMALHAALTPFLSLVASMYATLFFIGLVTLVTEWRYLLGPGWKKVLYAFTFPLFMFTYLPISVAALFIRVEWKPIVHKVSASAMQDRQHAAGH